MGSIFTALMPETKETLIQSMTVMGVSMGSLIGVPPTVCELYGTDIQKVIRPTAHRCIFGLLSLGVSAFCLSDDYERRDSGCGADCLWGVPAGTSAGIRRKNGSADLASLGWRECWGCW